ncbi:protein IRX15-LIKE-like [Wolffia australiana]
MKLVGVGHGCSGFSLHGPPRLLFLLVLFVFFFTFLSLSPPFLRNPPPPFPATSGEISAEIFDALVHYSTATASPRSKMPEADVRDVATAIRRRRPCNLLIFGLGYETLLWRSLNHGGRTVFVDDNAFRISVLEERYRGLIEAYDVRFSTKVSDLADLIAMARAERRGNCRPSQNLLFSDCRLAINDLPDEIYDVAWDVILIDGPRGDSASAPGRSSPIFTTAVLARAGVADVDVFVHDYDREVEKQCSDEFLCQENLVFARGQLAHFSIPRPVPKASRSMFCRHSQNLTSP